MNKIQTLVADFTSRLEAEIRAQVLAEVQERVQSLLGNGKRAAGRRAPALRARTGGRRGPEEMERTAQVLLTYINRNPGQRSEQIAAGTGLPTSEMALPLRKLVSEKKLKTKGKARGTTYTAA